MNTESRPDRGHDTPFSASDRERFGPDPAAGFAANLARVHEQIAQACASANRDPSGVRLLPISKTVPAHVLRAAVQAGIRDFGENKIQEAQSKAETLHDLPVQWSIVGHLQTNKAKYLARFAREFHALDSLKLADALNKRLDIENRDLDVFVQVNTSGEASKFGLHPDDVFTFITRLPEFPRLKPRGLMTLAVFSAETERVRTCFRLLRELRDNLGKQPGGGEISGLSMGMSGDFAIAIEEGATVVRVGQAIFGARPQSDAHYWPGLIPEHPIKQPGD